MTSPRSFAWIGAGPTPILIDARSWWLRHAYGESATIARRRSHAATASPTRVSGINNTNSSPPMRPITSVGRRCCWMTAATCCNKASPASCPCRSLIFLAIAVDDRHGERPTRALAAVALAHELLPQTDAIPHARERVVIRDALELGDLAAQHGFAPVQIGHVARRAHGADETALVVEHRHARFLQPALAQLGMV